MIFEVFLTRTEMRTNVSIQSGVWVKNFPPFIWPTLTLVSSTFSTKMAPCNPRIFWRLVIRSQNPLRLVIRSHNPLRWVIRAQYFSGGKFVFRVTRVLSPLQAWIKEKEPQLQSTNYGNNLFEVQKLLKRHRVSVCGCGCALHGVLSAAWGRHRIGT